MEEFDRLSVSQFDADHAEKDIHEARAFESALIHEQLSELDSLARRQDSNNVLASLHQADAAARDRADYLGRRAALFLQQERAATVGLGTKKALTDSRFVVQLHRERIHRTRHQFEDESSRRTAATAANAAALQRSAEAAAVGLDGAVPRGAVPPPRPLARATSNTSTGSSAAYGDAGSMDPYRDAVPGTYGRGEPASRAPFGSSAPTGRGVAHGDPSFASPRGAAGTAGGASRRGVVVVRVQVDLGGAVPATIDVRDTDEPAALASSFALAHGLSAAATDALRGEIAARQRDGVALYRDTLRAKGMR